MAGSRPGSGRAFLQGLFGTFQEAVQAGAGTSALWTRLREAVGTSPLGIQPRNARGQFITTEEAGAGILSRAGVGIQDVNAMRSAAGAWLTARNRLNALSRNEAIGAEHIFVPEWRTTGLGKGNPPQYRIRILRRMVRLDGMAPPWEEWRTYDLGGSLGTVGQVVARANQAYGRARYSAGSMIDAVLQYEIEVI